MVPLVTVATAVRLDVHVIVCSPGVVVTVATTSSSPTSPPVGSVPQAMDGERQMVVKEMLNASFVLGVSAPS